MLADEVQVVGAIVLGLIAAMVLQGGAGAPACPSSPPHSCQS
jgi:hypothetical protein